MGGASAIVWVLGRVHIVMEEAGSKTVRCLARAMLQSAWWTGYTMRGRALVRSRRPWGEGRVDGVEVEGG